MGKKAGGSFLLPLPCVCLQVWMPQGTKEREKTVAGPTPQLQGRVTPTKLHGYSYR